MREQRSPNYLSALQKRIIMGTIALSIALAPGCKTEPEVLGSASGQDVAQPPTEDTQGSPAKTSCVSSEDCGDKYCVKGLCQAWECEDDGDCAASGEMARCDENTFRCVICEADDAKCLDVECAKDSECTDFDICTEDICNSDFKCEYPAIEDCCLSDEECDDGIECTLDRCKQSSCSYVPQDNFCCATDDHCSDGDVCTTDLCLNFQCIHPHETTSTDCSCEVYLECDDGNPCTQDLCAGGFCLHSALTEAELTAQDGSLPQCCGSDVDCSDEDVTTFERCLHNQCTTATAAACTEDSECSGGGTCTQSTCNAGHCVLEVLNDDGCCSSADDCPKNDGCFAVSCEDNICIDSDSSEPETLWEEGFDSASADLSSLGWTLENDGGGAYWQIAEKLYASFPACLCFGVTGCTSYEVGKTTSGTATSPEITLPADRFPRFSFEVATDIEPGVGGSDPSTQKDWLFVDVISGAATTRIFDKKDMLPSTDTNLSWSAFELSLEAFKGKTIQLRVGFDTKDGNDNNHQGVFFDDLKVTLDCP